MTSCGIACDILEAAVNKMHLKSTLRKNVESVSIRTAKSEEVDLVVKLVNQAGEGFPYYLWSQTGGPNSDPWEIGKQNALNPDHGTYFKKAWIAEIDSEVAGCMILHSIADNIVPLEPDLPDIVKPISELENLAVSTGFIFVLSTLSQFQGKGIGSHLLGYAERFAGENGLSLVVSNANLGARKLYERHGFRIVDRRPMVKQSWVNPGTEWLLMVKRN